MTTLATLIWDSETFNAASFTGGVLVGIVLFGILWLGIRWVKMMIEDERQKREAIRAMRTEQMRREIRAEVMAALQADHEDEELDPEEFDGEDSEDLPDGSTRHPA